jgi:hypothetical protein
MVEIKLNESIKLHEMIKSWEMDMGESFTDYFMHDHVNDKSWAFWLLGKGFKEHANHIIDEILAGETCIDQEVLYHIYPEYEEGDGNWLEESCDKNSLIWSEFLTDTEFYLIKINEFLNEDEDE